MFRYLSFSVNEKKERWGGVRGDQANIWRYTEASEKLTVAHAGTVRPISWGCLSVS